jgi:parallel beta-helix repeat protein
LHWGARAEIRNNVVTENILSGIAADYWFTNVSVYENQCESNGQSGIAFQDGAGGSVNDNTCRKNGDYGILVKDETTDVVVGTNTLEGNATGAAVTLQGTPLSEQVNPHEDGVAWAFKAGNYDYLEMVVERLRRYSSFLGGSLLLNYYQNILETDAWYGLPCAQEEAFTARVEHWIQERPKSPTPWILKAKADVLWMSDHRKENKLKGLLNGDQSEYQRRAKRAQSELQKAEELAGHTDPELYATWILLSGSTSKMDIGSVKELLRKSIAIEPSYLQASAYYVLVNSRHWNRKCNADTLNEALEFVYQEVAASSNTDVAEVVYARACFMNLGGFYCTEIKEGKGGNWQRIESGYRRLLSKYPDSDRFINELANAAVLFEERTTAVELFDQIGERIHLPTWSGKRRSFEQARKWARDPSAEHPCELAIAKAEDEARPKRTLIKSALTILGGFSLFTLVVTLLGVPAVFLSRSAAKRTNTQPSPPDSPDSQTD